MIAVFQNRGIGKRKIAEVNRFWNEEFFLLEDLAQTRTFSYLEIEVFLPLGRCATIIEISSLRRQGQD